MYSMLTKLSTLGKDMLPLIIGNSVLQSLEATYFLLSLFRCSDSLVFWCATGFAWCTAMVIMHQLSDHLWL